MSFNLPITIEPISRSDLMLAGTGYCPRCPLPVEGRPARSVELKLSRDSYECYQCSRCRRVFLVPA